ncbi:uncharacterized protein [Aristolochia californica]|uniref:uncharacterized protein n=1 Tax=Aristolochia californica TaxID=171875 RepID=UPI0035E18E8A
MNAEEDIAGLFDKLSDHLQSLEGNPSVTVDNNGVTFDGSSAGSSMTVHPYVPHLKSSHCCCINVYVNSNVQGVNNSIVVGSEVSMRDPGVRLSTPFPLMKRRSRKSRSKVHQEPLSVPSSRFGAVLLSVICVFLFMLLFAK